MKREKMQLTLVPSPYMDRKAKKSASEHKKVRLSRRARMFYGPSDWQKIYLKVHGSANEANLRIGQAMKGDINKHGAQESKRIGFVTTQTYEKLMGKAKKKSIWISEPSERITIGCDPEFALVKDSGEAAYADTAFTDKWAQLGSDGPCAELRPDASDSVEGLVRNIERLLKNNSRTIEKFKWIGGATYSHRLMSRRYPIGGHVHFGLPNLPGAARNSEHILQRRVGRILDEMVAVPLVRIDTPLPAERRGALRYGRFEDMKTYDYKFEWRVPSGLWLVHKDLTFAILCTAKAVVEEAWKRYADRDCERHFMMDSGDGDNLITSFGCIRTERVRDLVNNAVASSVDTDLVRDIHRRLKQMSTYCLYKDQIDLFIKLCCSSKMPLPTSKLELRRSWINGQAL